MMATVKALVAGRSAARRGLASQAGTLKTALYDEHVALGGKMVDFAGYFLPLQYPSGVKKECEQTRGSAALFDVSHMGQVRVHGDDRVKFVERLVVGDIAGMQPGQSQLSLITNEAGGIIDDTVITMEKDYVGMVINGACKHKDLAHMSAVLESFGPSAEIEHLEDRALMALQGPKAAAVLSRLVEGVDLPQMLFMTSLSCKVAGLDCGLTRCGYTGEDGFELSVRNQDAPAVMQALLNESEVAPAGLGARDTLRVEAGLCLYGTDINEETKPVEAGLLWTIGKARRSDPERAFIGSEHVLNEIKNKPPRKRAGFVINGAPARAGVKLFASEEGGEPVGEITSGTFSPTLGKPVAMGYVKRSLKIGTPLFAAVRNKMIPAEIAKMPFVPANYYRGPK